MKGPNEEEKSVHCDKQDGKIRITWLLDKIIEQLNALTALSRLLVKKK